MAAIGGRRANEKSSIWRSEASQFFNNDDIDSLVASGEYSAEDSTSEKVNIGCLNILF